ncbi:MAG: DUF1553 domain-containing protein [Planctomycetes bacterium]|nr:DUF1553 domain-containing protein [Planctomycetota bacterium]
MRLLLSFAAFALIAPLARGADLRVYPADVAIGGPNRAQQLLVVEEENGRVVRDLTAGAKYASSSDKVKVDATGIVTATGAGEAKITVTAGGKTATVAVRAEKPAEWNFRNHVIPTLTRAGCNAGACHGALAGKGGMKLSLRGFDPETDWFVLTRQALGRRADLNDPAESLTLKKATRTVPHGGGTRMVGDSVYYAVVHDWMKAGAPGPKADDATLERLDVFPPAILVDPKAAKGSFRTLVRAVYSDGTTEDVTRWARFGSSEELVARVSEEGVIVPAGHGEAAITIGFGTKVATLTVTAPYPNDVKAEVFAKSPRNNFVDEHVLRKLELLRVPPSDQCSDAEFVRRAYLDTCGIVPKPDEVEAFLKDADTKKRAKLVDKLLDHPAYIDYWAHKWSDLLLVSSRKLPQPAMWAFYRKLRQSVADNQPWDKFARDTLTANGSTLTNGAGNYFVLHKDVSELAEATSLTFLGTSIGCAKCHNHPLEKWTQDEYWAFANLFSRVGLKNGDRAGEVLIQSKSDGDALHLRRGIAMPPAPLDGKPLALDAPGDRRAYFADWLTAADNPYFAKAAVNRVWRNFMGRALVEAEDDLRETNPASNRELLDALAADFVKQKYDLKHTMRTVLNSAAYQRASTPLKENQADDRFYSRYLLRRLPGEVILDAYSDITGVPTPFDKINSAAGDASTPIVTYPVGTRAVQVPDSLTTSRFLDAFGRAERVQTCSCERTADASVTQALHLNNGHTLNDKLRDKSSAVGKWIATGLTDEQIVDRVFLLALSRKPTDAEKKKFLPILAESAKDGAQSRREGIEDFVWAVLTGREFLFNH